MTFTDQCMLWRPEDGATCK